MNTKQLSKAVKDLEKRKDSLPVDVTEDFEIMMDEIKDSFKHFEDVEAEEFAKNPFKKITDVVQQVKDETTKKLEELKTESESENERLRLNAIIDNCDQVFSQTEFLEYVKNSSYSFEAMSVPTVLESKCKEVFPSIKRLFKLGLVDMDIAITYSKKYKNDINFRKKTACATVSAMYLKELKTSRKLFTRLFYVTQTVALIRFSFLYHDTDSLSEEVYKILLKD